MSNFLSWLLQNKEWVFSGIGVFAVGGLFTVLRVLRTKTDTTPPTITGVHPTPELMAEEESNSPPSLAKPSNELDNTVVYIANSPLDPRLSDDELVLLRRFCDFPRNQYTQGYRVDYLRTLLPDISENTLMLFLESLFLKGYLAKHRTQNGHHTYYQLSHDAVRHLVNSNIVRLDAQPCAPKDAPQAARP